MCSNRSIHVAYSADQLLAMTTSTELLHTLTAQWQAIACGREQYGAGTASEQSVRFQMERLLPLTAARCRTNLDPSLVGAVAGLVSLVGMSPQTTITMAEALRPRELLLVTSENAYASIEAISAWLASASRDWPAPIITVSRVPPTDSNAIATSVREWLAPRRAADASARIMFDATGGKKSMSVVAGMLSVELALEVLYLDSVFDPSLKMPRPGSEVIVSIPRPREATQH